MKFSASPLPFRVYMSRETAYVVLFTMCCVEIVKNYFTLIEQRPAANFTHHRIHPLSQIVPAIRADTLHDTFASVDIVFVDGSVSMWVFVNLLFIVLCFSLFFILLQVVLILFIRLFRHLSQCQCRPPFPYCSYCSSHHFLFPLNLFCIFFLKK